MEWRLLYSYFGINLTATLTHPINGNAGSQSDFMKSKRLDALTENCKSDQTDSVFVSNLTRLPRNGQQWLRWRQRCWSLPTQISRNGTFILLDRVGYPHQQHFQKLPLRVYMRARFCPLNLPGRGGGKWLQFWWGGCETDCLRGWFYDVRRTSTSTSLDVFVKVPRIRVKKLLEISWLFQYAYLLVTNVHAIANN
jgi:hypothetical protein